MAALHGSDFILLIVFWSGWCVLHSGMIALSVTRFLEPRLGRYYRFYRLFFNVTAVATLIPLHGLTLDFGGSPVYSWEGGWQILRYLLLLPSLALFVLGARKYDLAAFFGLAQITSGKTRTVMSESGELDTTGILGMTRHPWYLGGLLFLWSWQKEVYPAEFAACCVLSAYLVIGTLLEERKLRAELGQRYLEYSREVSMLVPVKWLGRKLPKF